MLAHDGTSVHLQPRRSRSTTHALANVLTLPFADVTAVEADGYELPDSSYTVESWGIRLFSDPRLDCDDYGPSVTVTANFASTVPELIKRATIVLALVDLNGGTSTGDSVLPELPANVKSFSVKVYAHMIHGTDDRTRKAIDNAWKRDPDQNRTSEITGSADQH